MGTNVKEGLARQERQLRLWLRIGAAAFVLEAAIYVPEVFMGPPATRPYAINSVVKDLLFAALAAAAASDIRRRARLISLIIGGHVVIVILLALALATGDSAFSFPPPGWLVNLIPSLGTKTPWPAVTWLIGASVATVALAWLLHRAQVVRYDLKYLWPTEHSTLAAVADAILTEPRMSPTDIATAVDHYWASLDVGYKLRLRLSLWLVCLLPVAFLRPPMPLMHREPRRKFIERCFEHDVAYRTDVGPFRSMVQSAFRFAMQMVYLGYYNDPSSYIDTGYRRFSQRRIPLPAPLETRPLNSTSPPSGRQAHLTADVVVVGSGAGGSIVADALARRGEDVLIVERGRHVSPSEFTEDEADQYARLYSDGALQLSRDFTFQVLQGMCVGGSTVVNNGVCFDLPDDMLARWNGDEFDAGLDVNRLRASFGAVRGLIGAVAQADDDIENPIVRRLSSSPMQPVTANLHECLGCGYCNIGCSFNRKMSMLVGVLPNAQYDTDQQRKHDPAFRGRLRILPECEVTEIRHQARRAVGVRGTLRDGSGREFKAEARRVVLAAGAIHSSRILMASGIGGKLVGRGLSANLGSHMTAYWDEPFDPLYAFAGLQMSHYVDDSDTGHMIETWFNPVMSQSLVMPGWLDHHEVNMRRYTRLGCLGVLVGSTRDGNHVLRRRNLFTGAEIAFTPSTEDLRRLLAGLRHAGKLLLDAKATCVMPATFLYTEIRSPEELAKLDIGGHVRDASDISVNTGHPQGGNPISRDPGRGVVDETLRVHGFDNLHVCDASVFPTAITVNPQLTVMALAHYAASAHMRD